MIKQDENLSHIEIKIDKSCSFYGIFQHLFDLNDLSVHIIFILNEYALVTFNHNGEQKTITTLLFIGLFNHITQ